MHSFRYNFRIFPLILGISNMVSQVSDKPFSKLDNKIPVDQLTRRKSQFNLNNEKDRHEDVGLCVRRTKKLLQGSNFTTRKEFWEKRIIFHSPEQNLPRTARTGSTAPRAAPTGSPRRLHCSSVCWRSACWHDLLRLPPLNVPSWSRWMGRP